VNPSIATVSTPWPERSWAVEGAHGLGHGVSQLLVAAGEYVQDVPAKLAARARLLGGGSARKTDRTDAASVAAVAQHHRHLLTVQPEGVEALLRLLSERRDDLVNERTRHLTGSTCCCAICTPAAPSGT